MGTTEGENGAPNRRLPWASLALFPYYVVLCVLFDENKVTFPNFPSYKVGDEVKIHIFCGGIKYVV